MNRTPPTDTLTCPASGTQEPRDMPADACMYLYRCDACGTTSKPRTRVS